MKLKTKEQMFLAALKKSGLPEGKIAEVVHRYLEEKSSKMLQKLLNKTGNCFKYLPTQIVQIKVN